MISKKLEIWHPLVILAFIVFVTQISMIIINATKASTCYSSPIECNRSYLQWQLRKVLNVPAPQKSTKGEMVSYCWEMGEFAKLSVHDLGNDGRLDSIELNYISPHIDDEPGAYLFSYIVLCASQKVEVNLSGSEFIKFSSWARRCLESRKLYMTEFKETFHGVDVRLQLGKRGKNILYKFQISSNDYIKYKTLLRN